MTTARQAPQEPTSPESRPVPREPTPAMLEAVRQKAHPNRRDGWDLMHASIWRRMWDAAQKEPQP